MQFLFLFALCSVCAYGIEIEIRFPLLEKQLSQQLFTQDGKHYVRGHPTSRCNYAFLASPRFGSRDGKLAITARFSGSSSLDVFGRCVGFADTFDFEILSALMIKNGSLVLADPQVKVLSRESFYTRQVQRALRVSIRDAVTYPIREELRKLLSAGAAPGPYKVSIQSLEVRRVEVLPNSLLVTVDTRLLVE